MRFEQVDHYNTWMMFDNDYNEVQVSGVSEHSMYFSLSLLETLAKDDTHPLPHKLQTLIHHQHPSKQKATAKPLPYPPKSNRSPYTPIPIFPIRFRPLSLSIPRPMRIVQWYHDHHCWNSLDWPCWWMWWRLYAMTSHRYHHFHYCCRMNRWFHRKVVRSDHWWDGNCSWWVYCRWFDANIVEGWMRMVG